MTYATASQFVRQFGLNEAAALLCDEESLVTPELLAEAIAGQFDPDRSEAEIKAAQAALSRLGNILAEMSRLMDGYFRSAVALPLTDEQISAAPVATCCMELARCTLMDDPDNSTDLADTRYRQWRDWLRDIATGKIMLVAEQQAGSSGIKSGRIPSRYNWGRFRRGW